MSTKYKGIDLLLGNIPSFQLTSGQTARWRKGGLSPTCTFLRDPINLKEISRYKYRVAIWRENCTLTYVAPKGDDDTPRDYCKCLSLQFGSQGATLHIVGRTEAAITATANFFMDLEDPTERTCFLRFKSEAHRESFYCCAALPQFFERIFNETPSRELQFHEISLTAEQCTVLATRPHPIQLTFSQDTRFKDGGTAFVDALEKRTSSFGSLKIEKFVWLSRENLGRLLKLAVIEHLSLPRLGNDELALLALSAKVKSLTNDVDSSILSEAVSLNIVAEKLSLTIFHSSSSFPTEHMLSFLQNVAGWSHLSELDVTLSSGYCSRYPPPVSVTDAVVQGIINAVIANSSLEVFALETGSGFCKGTQLVTLLQHVKDHKSLHTLKVPCPEGELQPVLAYLPEFLSLNRNITVKRYYGRVYSDGPVIDNLYALNRFYRGSASLAVEPPSERSSLVTTALMKSASINFQRSSLLLANHVDAVCERIEFANLNELDEDDVPMPSQHEHKRQRRL